MVFHDFFRIDIPGDLFFFPFTEDVWYCNCDMPCGDAARACFKGFAFQVEDRLNPLVTNAGIAKRFVKPGAFGFPENKIEVDRCGFVFQLHREMSKQ